MKDWGVLEWDKHKGYAVSGFGVEVLEQWDRSFEAMPNEVIRRADDARLRLEVMEGRSRRPAFEGRT